MCANFWDTARLSPGADVASIFGDTLVSEIQGGLGPGTENNIH